MIAQHPADAMVEQRQIESTLAALADHQNQKRSPYRKARYQLDEPDGAGPVVSEDRVEISPEGRRAYEASLEANEE